MTTMTPADVALARWRRDLARDRSKHGFVPRQGEPNTVYRSEPDALLRVRSITADADGIVHPQTLDDVRVADVHRLPAVRPSDA